MSFEDQTFTPCDCAALAYRNGGMKVAHWRALVDSRFLNHAMLDGKDCSLTIKSVHLGEVETNIGKSKKAHMFFEGREKPMLCGVTVLSAVAKLHGDDYKLWPGKRITIFPTIVSTPKGEVGAIRVRPKIPDAPKGGKQEREPGADG